MLLVKLLEYSISSNVTCTKFNVLSIYQTKNVPQPHSTITQYGTPFTESIGRLLRKHKEELLAGH